MPDKVIVGEASNISALCCCNKINRTLLRIRDVQNVRFVARGGKIVVTRSGHSRQGQQQLWRRPRSHKDEAAAEIAKSHRYRAQRVAIPSLDLLKSAQGEIMPWRRNPTPRLSAAHSEAVASPCRHGGPACATGQRRPLSPRRKRQRRLRVCGG